MKHQYQVRALDDLLSRNLDEAIQRFTGTAQIHSDHHNLQDIRVAPQPTTTVALPAPSEVMESPPPRLPYLEFSSFVESLQPLFKEPSRRSSPSRIPAWCPMLPSFTRNGVLSEGLPTFYDLSSLPELKDTPQGVKGGSRRGILDVKPRQSRFFPSKALMTAAELGTSSSPDPTVKLPPTACNLSAFDIGIEERSASPTRSASYNPASIAESVERAFECSIQRQTQDDLDGCAANLWRVQVSSRAELEATEVPYAHANSLTGYNNAAAVAPLTIGRSGEHAADSGVYLEVLREPAAPANDLDGGHQVSHIFDEGTTMATVPRMPTHVPHIESSFDLLFDFPKAHANFPDEHITSSAQYHSEAKLFEASGVPVVAPEDELMDVATFLRMGHVADCWCCNRVPPLMSDESSTEDDDWLIYSPAEDEAAMKAGTSDAEVILRSLPEQLDQLDAAEEWEEVMYRTVSDPDDWELETLS